jgi:hypothetical protein
MSSFRAANVYHPPGLAPMALVVLVLGWEHLVPSKICLLPHINVIFMQKVHAKYSDTKTRKHEQLFVELDLISG